MKRILYFESSSYVFYLNLTLVLSFPGIVILFLKIGFIECYLSDSVILYTQLHLFLVVGTVSTL